jgi:bifunctional DNA-binding transcriptional regulator/antitoxin component of YhaV-PrlF toxin-antitoxin module
MRVTKKGQVTISRGVREAPSLSPETEIEFVEDDGRFYIKKLRGIASDNMSTDEIMKLIRES